jgi:hypothetical protein
LVSSSPSLQATLGEIKGIRTAKHGRCASRQIGEWGHSVNAILSEQALLGYRHGRNRVRGTLCGGEVGRPLCSARVDGRERGGEARSAATVLSDQQRRQVAVGFEQRSLPASRVPPEKLRWLTPLPRRPASRAGRRRGGTDARSRWPVRTRCQRLPTDSASPSSTAFQRDRAAFMPTSESLPETRITIKSWMGGPIVPVMSCTVSVSGSMASATRTASPMTRWQGRLQRECGCPCCARSTSSFREGLCFRIRFAFRFIIESRWTRASLWSQ